MMIAQKITLFQLRGKSWVKVLVHLTSSFKVTGDLDLAFNSLRSWMFWERRFMSTWGTSSFVSDDYIPFISWAYSHSSTTSWHRAALSVASAATTLTVCLRRAEQFISKVLARGIIMHIHYTVHTHANSYFSKCMSRNVHEAVPTDLMINPQNSNDVLTLWPQCM